MHGHRPVHEISGNHDDVRIQGVRALHNLPNALLPRSTHADPPRRRSIRHLPRQTVSRKLVSSFTWGTLVPPIRPTVASTAERTSKTAFTRLPMMEPFRPVPPAEQNQKIQFAHHRRQQRKKKQEKNGEQPRGRQQNVSRQNRGEKHKDLPTNAAVMRCRHANRAANKASSSWFSFQRQNSAAENVNRQQCSENQNHMSLS